MDADRVLLQFSNERVQGRATISGDNVPSKLLAFAAANYPGFRSNLVFVVLFYLRTKLVCLSVVFLRRHTRDDRTLSFCWIHCFVVQIRDHSSQHWFVRSVLIRMFFV